MIRFSIFQVTAICLGLFTQTQAFAYECNESDAYKKGREEIALVRKATMAQYGRAVKFVQDAKGVTFEAALGEVMRTGAADQTRPYDEQLETLGAKIKDIKPDSPQACEALLLLQRQHAHVGQQKIDFVAKLVTGEDSSAR